MTTALTLLLTEAQAENAIQLLDEDQGAKLDLLVREVADVLRLAPEGQIQAEAQVHDLNNLLGRGAKALKELDRLRRQRVDPLNAEVANVNGLFRPITHALEQLTERGKKLIGAWQAQERARVAREADETRRRQEAAARAEAEALAAMTAATNETARQAALEMAEAASRQQTALALEAPAPTPKGYKSDEATTTVKGRWVFEVVKPDLLPREYMEPAPAKIRAAVAAGVREIAGVSITQEDQVIVRSR